MRNSKKRIWVWIRYRQVNRHIDAWKKQWTKIRSFFPAVICEYEDERKVEKHDFFPFGSAPHDAERERERNLSLIVIKRRGGRLVSRLVTRGKVESESAKRSLIGFTFPLTFQRWKGKLGEREREIEKRNKTIVAQCYLQTHWKKDHLGRYRVIERSWWKYLSWSSLLLFEVKA